VQLIHVGAERRAKATLRWSTKVQHALASRHKSLEQGS